MQIDYKHFIAHNITPQFEFGFGLSYTTFEYRNLSIRRTNASYQLDAPRGPDGGVVPEGGLASLWDALLEVSHDVQNTGQAGSAEVSQLYIGIPGGPLKQLRGFDKRYLHANETKAFTFSVTRRDLSVWTPDGWVLPRGCHFIYVGKSVLDIRLTSILKI